MLHYESKISRMYLMDLLGEADFYKYTDYYKTSIKINKTSAKKYIIKFGRTLGEKTKVDHF